MPNKSATEIKLSVLLFYAISTASSNMFEVIFWNIIRKKVIINISISDKLKKTPFFLGNRTTFKKTIFKE